MTDIPEIPFGAIENGRVFLQRLADHYDFTCEAGPLANCIEYHEAVRCFEFIAQWISEFSAAIPHISVPCAVEVDALAQEIRMVNCKNDLGAGELAEALIPFLSCIVTKPVDVKADPWVDTRIVKFDDTISWGHGGFDFDRWENLRWEMHSRHGSFAVWKSSSHHWSLYGGKYGVLIFDRIPSEHEAKETAEQLVISYDDEPVTKPIDVAAVRRQAFEEGFENGVEQSLNALDAYDDITRNEAEQGIRKLKPDYRALSAEPVQGCGSE